mmetsp:Transcript_65782/g.152849  ORF Transcript_65782/g.152849 Transcript_65782/m.152849 type:complete len:311 (-) Transcript_65782:719-1651(-)
MFAVSFSKAFSCISTIGCRSFARMPRRSSSPTFRSGSTFMRLGVTAAITKASGALPLAMGAAMSPMTLASAGIFSLRSSCVTMCVNFTGSGLPPFFWMAALASFPNFAMASGPSSSVVSLRARSATYCVSKSAGCFVMGPRYSRNSATTAGKPSCWLALANKLRVSFGSGALWSTSGAPLRAMSSDIAAGPPTWSLTLTMSPLRCASTAFISDGCSKMWEFEALAMTPATYAKVSSKAEGMPSCCADKANMFASLAPSAAASGAMCWRVMFADTRMNSSTAGGVPNLVSTGASSSSTLAMSICTLPAATS